MLYLRILVLYEEPRTGSSMPLIVDDVLQKVDRVLSKEYTITRRGG